MEKLASKVTRVSEGTLVKKVFKEKLASKVTWVSEVILEHRD